MNKKSYLLPHACQKAGWWMLLASLVFALCYVAIDSGLVTLNLRETPAILTFLATGLPFLSLMTICISQERNEDEYIQSLRARAVFIVVMYDFVVNMIVMSLTNVLVHHIPFDEFAAFHYVTSMCTNLPLLIVIYLVIFKGTLFINQIKMRHDRQ